MLFILYGATLEMGYQSRELFKELGFDIIQKYNYVTNDSKLNKTLYENAAIDEDFARWYNDKIYVSSFEEIEQCDFRYGLDGVCVGFNKEQILNAVHGTTDALLTIGTSTLEFVMQLKKAYGDYITLINIFSDTETVLHDYQLSEKMSKEEFSARNAANRKMQKIYLDNIEAFDETVIYTGDESVFDHDALQIQFNSIIRRRRLLEKELNSKTYVELPYKGNSEYLFISYSHQNKEQVYSELLYLQKHSYRIWYDDGIRGGENWRKIISDKISRCSQFLLFVSKESCESYDVQAEINLALDLHKKFVIINLDNTQLPNEYRMYLMNVNQIHYHSEDYYRKLKDALFVSLKETPSQ